MQSYDGIWTPVYEELKNRCSEVILNLWFSKLQLIAVSDKCVVLLSDSDMKADIINKRQKEIMQQAFEKVMGFPVDVIVLSNEKQSVDAEQIQTMLLSNQEIKSFSLTDAPAATIPAAEQKPEPQKNTLPEDKEAVRFRDMLEKKNRADTTVPNDTANSFVNREYTFENFIVGGSNKLAHAACVAISNGPASEYNPLFIYGPSGIGKTHLLYAMRNAVRQNRPETNVIYVKGEEFTIQMIDAITNKTTAEFRDKYRKADILLIDDIHFIAGHPSTQEEFFNTFNALYEEQKHIVLTSDRPPKDIKTLEQRLETRFEWGLIADIQPPDYELRIAILQRKAQIMQIDISMEILTFLADKLKGNIRQIEGAIKRLGAYQNLTHVDITLENTREILSDIMPGPVPETVKIEKILSSVAKKYGISVDEIKGQKRTKEIALARHISIFIVRKLTDKSYPEIGKIFNRDHTTILSSISVIERRMLDDVVIETEVNDLVKEITNIA